MAIDKEIQKDNIRETHWIGEVVDNADPSNLGRCRVKVFGKFDQLPDEVIPWATPMNRDNVGAHHTPNIGTVVAVRFDNGNIYHPEYWFQIDQDKNLKKDILDPSAEPQNVVSLVYDAERNVRIWWSPEDGLTMTTGENKDAAPAIRFSNDGKIYLHSSDIFIASSNNDESEPAVRGVSLESWLDELLDDYQKHWHPTPTGPSGPPAAPTPITISTLKSKHNTYQQKDK